VVLKQLALKIQYQPLLLAMWQGFINGKTVYLVLRTQMYGGMAMVPKLKLPYRNSLSFVIL